MTQEQKIFILAYRLAESKLRKSGPVFSEAEILEDFECVYSLDRPIPRGQWCELQIENQNLKQRLIRLEVAQ